MEKKVTFERETRVCDDCGKERLLVKCDYCGKEICFYCKANVCFTVVEDVRGHCIGFFYQKTMCQSHLPKGD